MLRALMRLKGSDQGATAVEYGLIVSLIFLACAGAIGSFGLSAQDMFNFVSNEVVSNS